MLVTVHRRHAGRVEVDAPGVAGSALWRGEGDPVTGVPVHVELEVPDEVDWERIAITPSGAGAQAVPDDALLLSGVVEHLDDDGVVTLRVAGSIVLVETVGTPPPGVDGKPFTLAVRRAEVYPTGA